MIENSQPPDYHIIKNKALYQTPLYNRDEHFTCSISFKGIFKDLTD